MDISQISDSLFISTLVKPKNFNEIYELGIRAIVNLVPNHDYDTGKQFKYLHESFNDSRFVSKGKLERIFDFIQKEQKNGGVLVHCNLGISRSPGIIVGALMLEHPNWSWRKALKYVRRKREVFVSIFIKISVLRYVIPTRK